MAKSPINAPIKSIKTKHTGNPKMCFPPIWIDNNPTATIAIKWSNPRIGCNKPDSTFAVSPTANVIFVENKYTKAAHIIFLFILCLFSVHI